MCVVELNVYINSGVREATHNGLGRRYHFACFSVGGPKSAPEFVGCLQISGRADKKPFSE